MKKLSINIATIAALMIAVTGCQLMSSRSQNLGLSETLENTLSAVVTITVEQTDLGKTAFGYAENATENRSVSDIAYSEILELEDAESMGSGFVIERHGKKYVITNAHVIEQAQSLDQDLMAYSYSHQEHPLKFIGADSYYDIAVLEFADQPDGTISSISFADDNYRIGQRVYAIGNPLGYFPYTVTEGIISAKNRPGITAKAGYLQSSAMISSGNSGGPLLNEAGELVGVNTLGSSEAQQLNFALEARILENLVDEIILSGRVVRAFLGIEVIQLYQYSFEDDRLITKLLNEKPKLSNVIANSPAAERLADYVGYEIIKANGQEIYTNEELIGIFESMNPSDTLNLQLENEGFLDNVFLVADELTDDRLSDIADFYFSEHYNISLSTNEYGVILNYPKGYQYNTFQYYDYNSESFKDYAPRGERTYILACGNTSDMEDIDFWRVESKKDLGNALRLSTMNGQISFLEYDDPTPYVIRVLLSDRDDLISKTILY